MSTREHSSHVTLHGESWLPDSIAKALADGAGELGTQLALVDREGMLVSGQQTPPPQALAKLGHVCLTSGDQYFTAALQRSLGHVVVGPFSKEVSADSVTRLGRHLSTVANVLLHERGEADKKIDAHRAELDTTRLALEENNNRLHTLVDRLKEADRVKSNFLATVSHELRTPLTSVIGYSEMLLEGLAGELNPEQREYVQTVMEKGDQLLQLISGVLDISRIEAGEMRFYKKSFALGQIVEVAVNTVAPLARRKRIETTTDMPANLPLAYGDPDRLRQVVLNLLSNALKFTPEGGRVAIDVRPAEADPQRMLQLNVRDTGIGIDKPQQTQIFEAFYQVDGSSTREYGGAGLGLNIVRGLVEAQGGRVWVESIVGRGATFSFTVPIHQGESE